MIVMTRWVDGRIGGAGECIDRSQFGLPSPRKITRKPLC
jgi:hypothetical protein